MDYKLNKKTETSKEKGKRRRRRRKSDGGKNKVIRSRISLSFLFKTFWRIEKVKIFSFKMTDTPENLIRFLKLHSCGLFES